MDQRALESLLKNALAEDIGAGDHSTLSSIPAGAKGRAVLKIKEAGILAGVEVARTVFRLLDADSEMTVFKKDGESMSVGDKAFELSAAVHAILQGERLALNCMQRMCGIATLTHSYTEKLKGYKTKLLDTRKTTPNFRLLEKEAVRIGGGENHRFGLYDMIMLKDNHVDYSGSLEAAIDNAANYIEKNNLNIRIEIETRDLDEVKRVVEKGRVHRIMLDNFTPDNIRAALKIIDNKFETEASGGINLQNIQAYAATGVDYISSGSLIHHAVSLDLSLKAIKAPYPPKGEVV